jgi:hypothetical protein
MSVVDAALTISCFLSRSTIAALALHLHNCRRAIYPKKISAATHINANTIEKSRRPAGNRTAITNRRARQ